MTDCDNLTAESYLDVRNFKKHLKKRKQALACKCSPSSEPPSIQLPLFKGSSKQRGAFNEAFRCALFNARNRKLPRKYLKKEVLPIISGGGTITYTGEELRQDDATVWLHLIFLAKESPLGNAVEFRPLSFCKAIGWEKINGGCYIRLRNCLTRLQATSLEIYSERLKRGVSLSMLPVFEWHDSARDKALSRYRVKIDPSLVELFEGNQYTLIKWEQRLALPDGLASWMHNFYSGHKQTSKYKYSLEKVAKGAGITVKQIKHLRELFKNALEALKGVGFISSYSIEGDLIHLIRI